MNPPGEQPRHREEDPYELIGKRFGPEGCIEILHKVGEGGMGVVYKGWDEQHDRPVAMKFLRPDRILDREVISRFKREGRNFSRIKHPNLVSVYLLGREQGLMYIATEYVDGRDLFDILTTDGPFPVSEALRICRCIARGLGAVHEMRVIHRDLKPENIMIRSSDGVVKVLDFGIAKHLDASQALTRFGSYLGTAGYSAPEQIRGEEIDHRADIFSLGIILYEMLTGKLAFDGRFTQEVMEKTLKSEPEPVERVNPGIVAPVASLISKMIRKRPSKRFQTMEEVVECIDKVTADLDSGAIDEEPGLFRRILKRLFEG